jgi:dTDP-4-dehydrorhamnose 3,5-epimerase
MRITKTILEGVIIIEPTVFSDNRGWFMESYNSQKHLQYGLDFKFIQDNHSYSAKKGTLRGLHFQLNPKAQTKLIRCTKGSIYDVVVDIRKNSPTFKKWIGIEINADNKKQVLVPKGFAHGFLTLSDDTEVQYKVDEIYWPALERSIIWNDPSINIDWPIDSKPILSEKDNTAPLFKEVENNFFFGEAQ